MRNALKTPSLFLEIVFDAPAPATPILRKAWSILSNSLRCLGRHDQALEAINEGLIAYPADPELLFRRGALNQTCGWFEQAVHDYRHLLELPSERVFQSLILLSLASNCITTWPYASMNSASATTPSYLGKLP